MDALHFVLSPDEQNFVRQVRRIAFIAYSSTAIMLAAIVVTHFGLRGSGIHSRTPQ
jgi:hypothetical protein